MQLQSIMGTNLQSRKTTQTISQKLIWQLRLGSLKFKQIQHKIVYIVEI
jgi:hypothetical protein